MVQVERRMYCFHESLPDSRPPPVVLVTPPPTFSPPKAPPISAPLVGMLTLTIPQSDPLERECGECTLKTCPRFWVKRLLDRPCSTSLFQAMAWSRSWHLSTYTMGAKVSRCTTGASWARPVTMVGSTKWPGPSTRCAKGRRPLPPSFLASATASRNSSTALSVCRGPHKVEASRGSPSRTWP
ncbi:unnamed protein product [Ixodes pacificus]